MTYLYECPVHGEMELEHRITEDRKEQFCLLAVATNDLGFDVCGESLKPLIGRHDTYRGDVRPAVFRGNHWHFKTQKAWTHETVEQHTLKPGEPGAAR